MSYLIFDKWDSNVAVTDLGLKDYICLDPKIHFDSRGRESKIKIHIVERLINNMMRSGTQGKMGGHIIRGRAGCGKKEKMMKIVKEAFEIIENKEKKNPIELFIRAIENAAPREETTRVKYGGIVTPIAVDVSPERRIDFALRNITKAVVQKSFNNKKTAARALAEEIIFAAQNNTASNAISKRNDVERTAKASR